MNCRKCGKDETQTEFYESANLRAARVCRPCHRQAARQYRTDHPEQVKAKAEKWGRRNRDKVRKYWEKREAQRSAEREAKRLLEGKRVRLRRPAGYTAEGWKWAHRVLMHAARRAAARGRDFALTSLADVRMLPGGLCPCCGVAMQVNSDARYQQDRASLDCVVPALGYVPGNVVWLCLRCNTLKNNASLLDLERLASYVRNYTPSGTVGGVPRAAGRLFSAPAPSVSALA
jgi:hypothetical protein